MFLYDGFVFVRSAAFLAALRWCFRFGVAVCVLLFVLIFYVIGQILSLLRFACVGSILYRAEFYRAKNGFILALNGIRIFCHIFPYFDKNLTI